jgi:hypothetical protein
MPASSITVPLVGMHFRPPAKFVLAALPAGAPLRLEAEPGNPYDAKAIRVFARCDSIPESQYGTLAEALLGTGLDIEDVLAGGIDPGASGAVHAGEIWLGYIADSDGKLCRQGGLAGNREVAAMAPLSDDGLSVFVGGLAASLVFAGDGSPGVLVRQTPVASDGVAAP